MKMSIFRQPRTQPPAEAQSEAMTVPVPLPPTAQVLHIEYSEVDLELGDPPAPDSLSMFDIHTVKIEHILISANNLLNRIDPSSLTATSSLIRVTELVNAARDSLTSLAEQNRVMAADASVGPATLRIRITRFSQLATDLSGVVLLLEEVRSARRDASASRLRRDVTAMDASVIPHLERADLSNGLPAELLQWPGLATHLVELNNRNMELQKLTTGLVALKDLFLDLRFLVDHQQSLLNETEYNIALTSRSCQKADTDLLEVEKQQRRARRRKVLVAVIAITVVAAAVAVVVIFVTR